eukprot:574077-Pelagomonas_calceolata.AAC.4
MTGCAHETLLTLCRGHTFATAAVREATVSKQPPIGVVEDRLCKCYAQKKPAQELQQEICLRASAHHSLISQTSPPNNINAPHS